MKKFSIAKDPVGGKIIISGDGMCEERYYTNEELCELYRILGELWINQKRKG